MWDTVCGMLVTNLGEECSGSTSSSLKLSGKAWEHKSEGLGSIPYKDSDGSFDLRP